MRLSSRSWIIRLAWGTAGKPNPWRRADAGATPDAAAVVARCARVGVDVRRRPGRHHDGGSRQHVSVEPGTRDRSRRRSSRSTPPTGPTGTSFQTRCFARNGLTLKEMTTPQREAAHALLKTGVSQHGYATATTIMSLENILRAVEGGGQFARDPDRYFFSVFGTPSEPARGDGASRDITSRSSSPSSRARVTVSAPTFFGSNPAEVRDGDRKRTSRTWIRGGPGARAPERAQVRPEGEGRPVERCTDRHPDDDEAADRSAGTRRGLPRPRWTRRSARC